MLAPGLPPLEISLELDGDFVLGALDDTAARQRAAQAFRQAAFLGAEFMRSVWLRVAGQMDIRGGFSGQGHTSYLQGIQTANIAITDENYADGLAAVTIAVTNTSEHAGIVEEGHVAFSMARSVNWGSGRVKRGKSGPYLHIPFRHTAHASDQQMADQGYTTSARRALMPADVTRAARLLAATTRHNVGPIHGPPRVASSGGGPAHATPGAFRAADRYTWGERLQRNTTPGIVAGPGGAFQEHRSERFVGRDKDGKKLHNPAWQNSKWNNLFRTASPGGGSTYMTIRTLTPNSLGWNVPAQPGRFVARRVATILQSGPVAAELSRIMAGPLEAALGLQIDVDDVGGS